MLKPKKKMTKKTCRQGDVRRGKRGVYGYRHRVITARDATGAEKKLYRRRGK